MEIVQSSTILAQVQEMTTFSVSIRYKFNPIFAIINFQLLIPDQFLSGKLHINFCCLWRLRCYRLTQRQKENFHRFFLVRPSHIPKLIES
jgi:hypothetical protein